MTERRILHVDADAFFVSVEQALDPSLVGKPVIVGGNPNARGVVASSSYEARALGVKTAMPLSQARRICPQAIFISGNFEAYGKASHEMREIFYSFTPDMEMASLDEAYLDLTGCARLHRHPFETAETIKLAVKRRVGINVSIGVASSKLVAKVASDYGKPSGITYVRPGAEAAFLRPLRLKDLPGVGPKTCERLERYSLRTIGDLQALGAKALSMVLGPAGQWLYARSLGIDSGDVEEALYPKSIGHETTFPADISDMTEIEATLSHLAGKAGRRLRREGMRARTVTVKLRYGDFSTYHMSRSFEEATSQDRDFERMAVEILAKLFTRGMRVRNVGVTLSNLAPDAARQARLFDEEGFLKGERLYRGIDLVRSRFGFSALHAGKAVNLVRPPPPQKRPARLAPRRVR